MKNATFTDLYSVCFATVQGVMCVNDSKSRAQVNKTLQTLSLVTVMSKQRYCSSVTGQTVSSVSHAFTLTYHRVEIILCLVTF